MPYRKRVDLGAGKDDRRSRLDDLRHRLRQPGGVSRAARRDQRQVVAIDARQRANVVAVLVGDENGVEIGELQPVRVQTRSQVANPDPAVDQQRRLGGSDQQRIARAAAAKALRGDRMGEGMGHGVDAAHQIKNRQDTGR
jgi:hypothetical protein